jgi:hypothetical protein
MISALTTRILDKSRIPRWGERYQKTLLFLTIFAIVLLTYFINPLFVDKSFTQSNIKIEGWVYDQDTGYPVAGAEIKIVNTSFQTSSDNSGFFLFEKLPIASYSLEVSSPDYQKEIISDIEITEDITRKINVCLRRKVFVLPPIEVTAERIPLSSATIEVIDKERINKLQVNTVAEVLETIEGLYVQKSGGMAGRHEISIRGSSPEHVLVLIDGHKINPEQHPLGDGRKNRGV